MRLGSRAKLTIGVGVVAAAGFAVLGLREWNRGEPRLAIAPPLSRQGSAPAALLLAASTRIIRTGETITADMIRGSMASVDGAGAAEAVAGAVPPAEAMGKVAVRDIPANTLIARAALGQEAKLAIRVPLGMRAISVDTTAEIAVAGLLRPGDRVDVQVVYPGADAITGARGAGRSQSQTLLQRVQVLAVGDSVLGIQPAGVGLAGQGASTEQSQQAAVPGAARTVTLALFPEQVSALSLAKSTGALHLSLRNPHDDAQSGIARAISAGPLPAVGPAAAPRASSPATPRQRTARAEPRVPPRPHVIDLVVGDSRSALYPGSDDR